jgi:PAS domain S-box-containing protein
VYRAGQSHRTIPPGSTSLSGTALVIATDESARSTSAAWLGEIGLWVVEAATADIGLREAAFLPELIVLDVEIDDGGGLELARTLRNDALTCAIPIILRSTRPGGDDELVAGLDAGAVAYLFEPITEQMLVATALAVLRARETQHQLEVALSSESSGVFDWRATTGEMYWSPSVEAMHQMGLGEFGGTYESFLETVHPDDRIRLDQQLGEALREDEMVTLTYRHQRVDGTSGWIAIRGSVFRDRDGTARRLFGLVLDVTDRERDRERLEQLHRLADELNTMRASNRVMSAVNRELATVGFASRLVVDTEDVAADTVHTMSVRERRLELFGVSLSSDRTASLTQAVALGHLAQGVLERAVRYEAERTNAIALQRALMPLRVPLVDGWQIDVEYQPARSEDRLGGDFYDVIDLGDRLVIVVGDVAGHGLSATAQMGTVRNLLRTLAVQHDGDPAGMLDEAARLVGVVGVADAPFVSAVVASIERLSGHGFVGSAGHPPPLHFDGSTLRTIDVSPSPPLGVSPTVPTKLSPVRLDQGHAIVGYSDGVFERRDMAMYDAITEGIATFLPPLTAKSILMCGDHMTLNVDDQAVIVVHRLA